MDVPSAAAVFGSHFLAHEAQQNFPVIRHRIIKNTNERQKRGKKRVARMHVHTFYIPEIVSYLFIPSQLAALLISESQNVKDTIETYQQGVRHR